MDLNYLQETELSDRYQLYMLRKLKILIACWDNVMPAA